jgi:hypothetical protein
MGLNCKNGDIAIVVRDNPGCEANLGRLVEVRGPRTSSGYPGMVCWQIRQISAEVSWVIDESNGSFTSEILTWRSGVSHPDAWLKPIRPDDTDEDAASEAHDPSALKSLELIA